MGGEGPRYVCWRCEQLYVIASVGRVEVFMAVPPFSSKALCVACTIDLPRRR